MKPTPTGIAVALAVAVVAVFFLVPGLSPWGPPTPTPAATQITADTQTTSTTTSSPTTTMPPKPVTQLMMKDDVVGTGAVAAPGDSVTVNYVGALTDGKVFDASANHGTTGFTFTLGAGQVIKGWDEGIVGMKVGGKRTLIIPATLAYGAQSPAPSIPANSDLVFQVELLKITPKK